MRSYERRGRDKGNKEKGEGVMAKACLLFRAISFFF